MRQLLSDKERCGKIVLVTAALITWLLILISFKYYGYNETWLLWKVPVNSPQFLDFRLIPGSAESVGRPEARDC